MARSTGMNRTSPSLQESSGRRSGFAVWFIVVLLAISPIPLGGTPPLSWAVWGCLVGLVAGFFAITRFFGQKAPVLDDGLAKASAMLFAVMCLYLVVQVLPFGDFAVTMRDGTVLSYKTISMAPGDTIMMLVRMLTFAMLFFLTSEVARRPKSRNLLANAIVIVVTAHAFYGLIALFQLDDTLLGMPKWKYQGVATGTFLNRNTFATYLGIGAVVAAVLAARSVIGRRDDRVRLHFGTSALLYLVALGIMMMTIVLTNSRAGLAVAFIGLGVVAISAIAYSARALWPVLIAGLVALVLFVVMFLNLGEALWLRFEGTSGSLFFRMDIYRQALDLIALRPWMGFGGGAFEQSFLLVHTDTLANQLTWDKAHNTYLELWSGLGFVIGSIPIVLVFGLFVVLVLRIARKEGSWSAQTSAAAAIALAAVHSIFDFSLEIQSVAFLFVVVCALGFSGSRLSQRGS